MYDRRRIRPHSKARPPLPGDCGEVGTLTAATFIYSVPATNVCESINIHRISLDYFLIIPDTLQVVPKWQSRAESLAEPRKAKPRSFAMAMAALG